MTACGVLLASVGCETAAPPPPPIPGGGWEVAFAPPEARAALPGAEIARRDDLLAVAEEKTPYPVNAWPPVAVPSVSSYRYIQVPRNADSTIVFRRRYQPYSVYSGGR